MQTETLKKLYDYMRKNKVQDFEIHISPDDLKIQISNLGINDVDSIEIFEESDSDSIFINSSRPL